MTEKYSVEVENNRLVDLYRNPMKFLILTACALFILWIIFEDWKAYFKKRVVMEETKNILYGSACLAAQQEQADDAMVLLRQAVAAGYSDFEHAKNDGNLRPLHGRVDFEALFSPDPRKTK